jgi:DNA primase large subunit
VALPTCTNDPGFVVKYPFTREGMAKYTVLTSKTPLIDLPNTQEGRQLLEKARDMLKEVLTRGSVPARVLGGGDGDSELLVHYLAVVLTAGLDKTLWRRVADTMSKRFSSLLENEDLDCIMHIARGFGIEAVPIDVLSLGGGLELAYDVGVRVWSYLRFAPRNDPNWKLVNRFLTRGWVLLTRHELVRLVEEAVEARVMSLVEDYSKRVDVARALANAVGGLGVQKSLVTSVTTTTTTTTTGVVVRRHRVGGVPPCMEAIISEIKSGGNPSHQARFALAAFMLRRCSDQGRPIEDCVEEVVGLFRTVADFDEKKTRYQVEHIAGLRGGRKAYMPPSCEELYSLGLCPTSLGCGVRNPLSYGLVGRGLGKGGRRVRGKGGKRVGGGRARSN